MFDREIKLCTETWNKIHNKLLTDWGDTWLRDDSDYEYNIWWRDGATILIQTNYELVVSMRFMNFRNSFVCTSRQFSVVVFHFQNDVQNESVAQQKNVIFSACMTDFWRVSNWMEKLQFQRFWCGCGRNGDERKWRWRKYQWIWGRFSIMPPYSHEMHSSAVNFDCDVTGSASICFVVRNKFSPFPRGAIYGVDSKFKLDEGHAQTGTHSDKTNKNSIHNWCSYISSRSPCFCLFNKAHSQCVLFSVLVLYFIYAFCSLSLQLAQAIRLGASRVLHALMIPLCTLNRWKCYGNWNGGLFSCCHSSSPVFLLHFLSISLRLALSVAFASYASSLLDFQFEIEISLAWCDGVSWN